MRTKSGATQLLSAIVGHNIRVRRTQLGLTQNELARALGIEVETVSRYERGLVAPSFPQLGKLCDVLGIPAWTLFSDGSSVPDAHGYTVDDLLSELSVRDREFVIAFVRLYVKHHKRPEEAASAP